MPIPPPRNTAVVPPTMTFDHAIARRWDAIVIGAGPAGAIAARRAATLGRDVLLVDRATFPRRKVCGCCINHRSMTILANAGLPDLLDENGAVPFSRLHLAAAQKQLTLPLPTGVALSRARFDAALVRAAVAAGTHFLPTTTARVRSLAPHERTARSITLTRHDQSDTAAAAIILVADGLAGAALADLPEFTTTTRPHARIGAATTLPASPSSYEPGTVYMASAPTGYVGLVRIEAERPDSIAHGRLNIAAALDPAAVRNHGLRNTVADIITRAGLPLPDHWSSRDATPWQGTPPLTRHPARIAAHRLLVLGDAAGYVEPFTGEGITWALTAGHAAGTLATPAALHWNDTIAHDWTTLYHNRIRRSQRTCRAVAALLRKPRLIRLALTLLTWQPRLAAPLTRRVASAHEIA